MICNTLCISLQHYVEVSQNSKQFLIILKCYIKIKSEVVNNKFLLKPQEETLFIVKRTISFV